MLALGHHNAVHDLHDVVSQAGGQQEEAARPLQEAHGLGVVHQALHKTLEATGGAGVSHVSQVLVDHLAGGGGRGGGAEVGAEWGGRGGGSLSAIGA